MKLISSYLIFIAARFFVSGFVISCLWNWFVVPLGIPEVSYLQAVGLTCVFFVLTDKRQMKLATEDSPRIIDILSQHNKTEPVAVNKKNPPAADALMDQAIAHSFWSLLCLIIGGAVS